jgi:hypothetical protein
MSFERPDSASDIDWENAPRGTTHAFIGSNRNYWMKLQGGTWFYFWNSDWSQDATDPETNRERCIPRPGSEAYDPRNEATHTATATGMLARAGKSTNRVWMWDGKRWMESNFHKSDLDSPAYFTPIQRTAPSTEIVFTMTEEQSKAIALDKRPMKVVMVQFQDTPNAKEYAYWAPEGTKTGDFAVVHQNNVTVASAFPFTVVKVTQDEVLDTSRATKAILGTFDESFALHVQARIEHMTRVKAKLAQKKKAFEESAFFEMLAKSDPEAAALLEELKQFSM